MGKLKTILTLVAAISIALLALAVIGLVYAALYYILLFGILCLGTLIALRFLGKSDPPQIDTTRNDPKSAARILDDYKQKHGL
jgi:hypothetical protein